jgi:hypothetical protein
LPRLDASFYSIRAYAGAHPRKPGVVVASLVLCRGGPRIPQQTVDLSMDGLAARPTSPLAPFPVGIDQPFPIAHLADSDGIGSERYFLDFTDGGKYLGVVMSQVRMQEIETVLQSMAGIVQINSDHSFATIGPGSWVDMLVGGLGSPGLQTVVTYLHTAQSQYIYNFRKIYVDIRKHGFCI